METLPQKLEIELTEQDVGKNLVKIVESMNNVRQESLKRRSVTDTAAYEYLHLAHRLASVLDHKRSDDEKLDKNMQSLVTMVNLDKRLKSYDPLQKGFWKKKNPGFVKNLDKLLISVMKDDVINMDTAYHIFNAVKHLGAEEHERDELLMTIRPYNLPVRQKKGLLSNLLAKIIGYRFEHEEPDELTLLIDGEQKHLPAALEEARDRGYLFLQANSDQETRRSVSFHSELLQEGFEPKKTDILSRLLKNNTFNLFAHYFVGNLPHYYARKLQKKYGEEVFNREESFAASAILNAFMGIGLAAYVGIAAMVNATPDLWYVHLPLGGYLFAESIMRGILSKEDNVNDYVGTLPGYFIFGPAAIMEAVFKDEVDENKQRGHEFTLQDIAENYKFNYFDDLEHIICLKPRNGFNTILAAFYLAYHDETRHELENNSARIDSKDVQAYYYSGNLGEYEKSIVFAGIGSSFYLLSMIHEKIACDKQPALALVADILQRDGSLQGRLLQIDKLFKPEYVRIGHYEKGKQIEFIEGEN